jgi:hypothetical protein
LTILRTSGNAQFGARSNERKGSEGAKGKATGGEAVLTILRTSGNAEFGALRPFAG